MWVLLIFPGYTSTLPFPEVISDGLAQMLFGMGCLSGQSFIVSLIEDVAKSEWMTSTTSNVGSPEQINYNNVTLTFWTGVIHYM